MLNNNFLLKIADFGFAAPVEGKDGSGNLTTKLGTLNYMAPEIHLKQPYQGRSVDLFAAAIILFIMVAAHPPFTTAEPQDPFYRCLAASRADIFWRTHCKSKENGDEFFSEDFKDLVQAMLQLDPAHRPSIPEVMAHKWMQGDMPTYEQIQEEFLRRDNDVKAVLEKERKEKEAEKNRRMETRRKAAMRSGPKVSADTQFDNSEDALLKPSKNLQAYERTFANNTEFFSTYNPDMIEEAITESLRTQKIEPSKVSKDKYKIQFTLQTKDQGGQIQKIDMCVRILNVDDKIVCVEFQRLGGDKQRFLEHYLEDRKSVV